MRAGRASTLPVLLGWGVNGTPSCGLCTRDDGRRPQSRPGGGSTSDALSTGIPPSSSSCTETPARSSGARSMGSPAAAGTWPMTRSPRRSPARSNASRRSANRSPGSIGRRSGSRATSSGANSGNRLRRPIRSRAWTPTSCTTCSGRWGPCPRTERAAVLLHDSEGFTSVEIGRMLGIAAATARVHVFRARRGSETSAHGGGRNG